MKIRSLVLTGAVLLGGALFWIGYCRFEVSVEARNLRLQLEHDVGIGADEKTVAAFFKSHGIMFHYDGSLRVYQTSLERNSWRKHKIFIQIWMDSNGHSNRIVVEDIYNGPFG